LEGDIDKSSCLLEEALEDWRFIELSAGTLSPPGPVFAAVFAGCLPFYLYLLDGFV
jgi:hypothetical protein